ncbi:jg26420 [Pararge aegeria aegeria]|uniref:Jg26420 protein n=1 Tax=Pararge aegeria aegeria TaxID=348720 RepID=A0A8S4RQK3_9NEOP|nr:jg26420 [Pararge aegeria aegeria]
MLGVSLRDQIRNVEIRRRHQSYQHSSQNREAEVAMGGHIIRRRDGRWGPKVLEWQPRTGKRSVGRPPTRWTDDIRRVAFKRHKTVEFVTPLKILMWTSSG